MQNLHNVLGKDTVDSLSDGRYLTHIDRREVRRGRKQNPMNNELKRHTFKSAQHLRMTLLEEGYANVIITKCGDGKFTVVIMDIHDCGIASSMYQGCKPLVPAELMHLVA